VPRVHQSGRQKTTAHQRRSFTRGPCMRESFRDEAGQRPLAAIRLSERTDRRTDFSLSISFSAILTCQRTSTRAEPPTSANQFLFISFNSGVLQGSVPVLHLLHNADPPVVLDSRTATYADDTACDSSNNRIEAFLFTGKCLLYPDLAEKLEDQS